MNNLNSQTKTNSYDTLVQKAMKLKYSMVYYTNLKNIKTNLELFIMDEV